MISQEFYSDEDMADSTEGADGKPPTAEEIAELVIPSGSEQTLVETKPVVASGEERRFRIPHRARQG